MRNLVRVIIYDTKKWKMYPGKSYVKPGVDYLSFRTWLLCQGWRPIAINEFVRKDYKLIINGILPNMRGGLACYHDESS